MADGGKNGVLCRGRNKRHCKTLLHLTEAEIVHITVSGSAVTNAREMHSGGALIYNLGKLAFVFLINDTDKELNTVILGSRLFNGYFTCHVSHLLRSSCNLRKRCFV